MRKSVIISLRRLGVALSITAPVLLICGFGPGMTEQDWLNWTNKCLTEHFDPSADVNLKKWEINLTNDHFLRLRKTYQHGKQEYYSFKLNKLNTISYRDTTGGASLLLSTMRDDIIVQTYDDPKGDIDSMATVLSIPVKSMPPARIDSLRNALTYFKDENL